MLTWLRASKSRGSNRPRRLGAEPFRRVKNSNLVAYKKDKSDGFMDYERPVRKLSLQHGRKSTPTPKFLSMAKAFLNQFE